MRKQDVVALGVLLFVGGLLAPVTAQSIFGKAKEKANITKCSNNMRQIGIGAIQYADHPRNRYFPHVGQRRDLDGDVNSNHAPKSVRAVLWYDYMDNPEAFICPSSDDTYVPIQDQDVRESMRKWFWNGDYAQARTDSAPWVHGDDPALSKTTELSYGYVRRTVRSNARSTTVIGADRAVNEPDDDGPLRGNHATGWNVMTLDCTTEFVKHDAEVGDQFAGAWLVSTSTGGGYLGIKPQTDKTLLATPFQRGGRSTKTKKETKRDEKTDAAEEVASKTGGGCGASCALEDDASMAVDALLLVFLLFGLGFLRRSS